MMSFPYEIKSLSPEVNEELMSKFKGERTGFVQVGPQKYIMSAEYAKHADKYYNFPLRKDDVWIVTYPRTGTTVTQELVWMINHNLDFEGSAKELLVKRFPFLEFSCFQHEDLINEARELNKDNPGNLADLEFLHTPAYEVLADMPSPRHVKTHLPFSLLPPDLVKTCKVIYSARNPKDVCESYFHHNMLIKFHDYQGDFDTYWDFFQRDLLLWSPFFEHVREGWELRHHPNVFFLFYEDLVKDMPGTIRKVGKFLGKTLSDDQVSALAKHLHIDNFREKVHFMNPVPGIINGSFKKFVRKGQTGSNSLFTEELHQKADAWISKETKRIGVKFPV